jgi:hypothetical protein
MSNDASKPASPSRPKHEVTRSISDVATPTVSKINRTHHHHPHLHHRHKDNNKGHHVSQPNLYPNASGSILEVAKSEGHTPDRSRSASRRTSLLAQVDGAADLSNAMAGSTYSEKRIVKEGEVDEEKNKAVLMASLVFHL